MEKQLKDLKPGEKIKFEDNEYVVKNVEVSNIGKHGRSKCRLVVLTKNKEEKILVRLSDMKTQLR
jgi:translation elongation factor P/translation initiation factor 5A